MKKFQKNKEDFVCENCGQNVLGNGYTNHCPKCLYSKHVDINPGDRLALESCGGLMKPVSVEKDGEDYVLVHKCKDCGHVKKNKTSPNDDFDKIVKLSSNVQPR